MISAMHVVPELSPQSSSLTPGGPSDAISQRFQDLLQPPAALEDGQMNEPIGTELDAKAGALDTQVLSGLVGATGLTPTDPESDDE